MPPVCPCKDCTGDRPRSQTLKVCFSTVAGNDLGGVPSGVHFQLIWTADQAMATKANLPYASPAVIKLHHVGR